LTREFFSRVGRRRKATGWRRTSNFSVDEPFIEAKASDKGFKPKDAGSAGRAPEANFHQPVKFQTLGGT
jgi:hypothetical protein